MWVNKVVSPHTLWNSKIIILFWITSTALRDENTHIIIQWDHGPGFLNIKINAAASWLWTDCLFTRHLIFESVLFQSAFKDRVVSNNSEYVPFIPACTPSRFYKQTLPFCFHLITSNRWEGTLLDGLLQPSDRERKSSRQANHTDNHYKVNYLNWGITFLLSPLTC